MTWLKALTPAIFNEKAVASTSTTSTGDAVSPMTAAIVASGNWAEEED